MYLGIVALVISMPCGAWTKVIKEIKMDTNKVKDLMDLVERAKVPPPNWEGPELPARNLAIIAKAEADIDAEVAAP